MSWCRSSCCASIFLIDNVLKALHGDFSSADFEQSAHNGAYHVAQEAVRSDDEDQLIIYLFPIRFRDVADKVVDLRMHF